MRDRVRAKFHVGMAEVGKNDRWQELVMGFSFCSSNKPHAEGLLDSIVSFVEELGEARISKVEREVLHYRLDDDFGSSMSQFGGEVQTWDVPSEWLGEEGGGS